MKKRPWYKRYPSNWLSGVMALSAEERGVYDTIIDMLYDRGVPIPDDPKELARICGCTSSRRYRAVRDRLLALGKITVADGKISNPRFEREWPTNEEEAEKLANNGRTGGQTGRIPPPNNGADLFGNKDLAGKGLKPNKILDTRGKKEEGAPTARATPGKRSSDRAPRIQMPADWKPTDEGVGYARARHFGDADIDRMILACRDNHIKKGTLIAGDRGLAATWRTWVEKEIEFGARDRRRATGNGRGDIYDIAAGRPLGR